MHIDMLYFDMQGVIVKADHRSSNPGARHSAGCVMHVARVPCPLVTLQAIQSIDHIDHFAIFAEFPEIRLSSSGMSGHPTSYNTVNKLDENIETKPTIAPLHQTEASPSPHDF